MGNKTITFENLPDIRKKHIPTDANDLARTSLDVMKDSLKEARGALVEIEETLEVTESLLDGLEDPEYPPHSLSASEALFGFIGWITTRKEKVIASASDEAGVWAGLVSEFCHANALHKPREGWGENLTQPISTSEVGDQ